VRIDVDGGGYDTAAEALFSGNQIAALHYNSLIGKLGGYGAMAGDDKSSEDFVTNYDTAAAEGVGAANDIVDSFATLGILTATTVENHRNANASSVYNKPIPVYDGSGSLPGEGPVDVKDFTPPSALGGDNEDLPEFWNHVVDHLQGWTWPSADTGRLRDAATTWKNLGDNVGRLTSYCDSAVTMFQLQKSPEIPLAIDAVNDLKQQVSDAAAEFRAIGQACSDYADQVEQTRDVIKGFLQDLAIEAGISVAAGIIVGIFTFGGGAAAGGGIAAWRAVACARKIIAALKALKAIQAVADIARTAPKLNKIRGLLAKFKDARQLRAAIKAADATKSKLVHSAKQLQKKYKHAKDFGVDGNCNPANAKKYQQALDDFVDAPSTLAKNGSYRAQNVVFNYDPSTRLCVIQGTDGSFVSGWKLSADQFANLIKKGVVGGG
jgi:hypothetical protein